MYIVTCSDNFTKWPEAAAITNKLVRSVADFLYKLITIHGSPAIVQSDQGREFINEILSDHHVLNNIPPCFEQVKAHLFELTDVEHRISAPYHPMV